MLTYQHVINERHGLEREYRIRNLLSCALIAYAAYCAFQSFTPASHPIMTLIIGSTIITSALCIAIVIVRLRQLQFTRKDESSLMDSIVQAIVQARLHGDYTLLNQMLDSKYSCHTILKMSELPEGAYKYEELSKWVKIKQAMQHFREHKITVKDFYNLDKMNEYLINVYPEFLDALNKHSAAKFKG